jgi:hypothetical protein
MDGFVESCADPIVWAFEDGNIDGKLDGGGYLLTVDGDKLCQM